MPFAEDVRSLTFPSLYNFRLASGKEVTQHKYLPTDEQQDAMDQIVDAMDLSEAGPPGSDGKPTSWFSCADSFSPGVHNVQNAIIYRISNPDGDLPPVHPALTKYLEPPKSVLDKLQKVGPIAAKAFDVTKGELASLGEFFYGGQRTHSRSRSPGSSAQADEADQEGRQF